MVGSQIKPANVFVMCFLFIQRAVSKWRTTLVSGVELFIYMICFILIYIYINSKNILGRINQQQKELLINEVTANYLLLFGTFASADEANLKKKKWAEIVEAINQIGPKKDKARWKKVYFRCLTLLKNSNIYFN